MKKAVFFLVVVFAIGLTSCNSDSVTGDDKAYEQGTEKDLTPSGGDKDGED